MGMEVLCVVRTSGSDRTVAKDKGTSDRTDHDHGNPNRIGLIRSRIGLIRSRIGLIRSRIGLIRNQIGLIRSRVGLIMDAWHGFLCLCMRSTARLFGAVCSTYFLLACLLHAIDLLG